MLPAWLYSKERLKYPLMREPGSKRGEAQFRRVSWDEALDTLTAKFTELREKHGNASIGFTRTSGASPLGDYRRLGSLLQGTSIYGGIDMGVHMGLNAVLGDVGMFGQDTNEWPDRLNAKTIISWGNNPAETSMTSYKFILDAQEAGARHIVIDPRYSSTAVQADWWIAPRPGTDLALALALIRVVVAQGLVDTEFVLRTTNAAALVRSDNGMLLRVHDVPGLGGVGESGDGFVVWDAGINGLAPFHEATRPELSHTSVIGGLTVATVYDRLVESVDEHTLGVASGITGLGEQDIDDLARCFVDDAPVTLGFGYGVDRYPTADALSHAGAILALLTGNIGKPGATVGVQSHGRGSHKVPLGRDAPLPSWARMVSLPTAQAGREPSEIRALFNMGDFLNQRIADMNTMSGWLSELDYVVTVDHVWNTTSAWSDLVLPASTFLEGTEPYRDVVMERNCVILRQTVVPPLEESKPDSEIERLIGERFGFGEYFSESITERIDRQLSESSDPLVSTLSAAALAKKGGAVRLAVPNRPKVAFSDQKFSTPSGRAELYVEPLAELGEALPTWRGDLEVTPRRGAGKYPLTFVQNHVRQRAHSTFYNVEWSLEIWPRPVLEINPADAKERCIDDGELVEVFNDRGSVTVHALLNSDYPPSMCSIAEGWKASQFVAGNLQELTNPSRNARQEKRWGHSNIAYFDTRVDVRPVGEQAR